MKKLILFVAVLPLLYSCSKKWHGCTDYIAINFEEKAEKDDGSCVYTKLTFYADSTQYPASPLDRIEIKVGSVDVGTITSVFPIGGPNDCGDSEGVTYSFKDAGEINWNARIYLVGGTVLTRTGTTSPAAEQDCILINAL